MRSKAYRIDITPVAWHRVVRNSHRSYDATTRNKVSFELYLAQQHNEEKLFDKPVHLDVIFYMTLSKSLQERKAIAHSTIPSLDSLCRFLLESLEGAVILDDRLICSLSAKKVYDKEPRTELIITEVV